MRAFGGLVLGQGLGGVYVAERGVARQHGFPAVRPHAELLDQGGDEAAHLHVADAWELPEPVLEDERTGKGLLDGHLLVEREPDQHRVGVACQQPVGLVVLCPGQRGGGGDARHPQQGYLYPAVADPDSNASTTQRATFSGGSPPVRCVDPRATAENSVSVSAGLMLTTWMPWSRC